MAESDARMPQERRSAEKQGVGQSGDLFAVLTRWEVQGGQWSWREGSETRKVTIGAHCVDLAWPWWKPYAPWNQ